MHLKKQCGVDISSHETCRIVVMEDRTNSGKNITTYRKYEVVMKIFIYLLLLFFYSNPNYYIEEKYE